MFHCRECEHAHAETHRLLHILLEKVEHMSANSDALNAAAASLNGAASAIVAAIPSLTPDPDLAPAIAAVQAGASAVSTAAASLTALVAPPAPSA